jgi:hypothetical protein
MSNIDNTASLLDQDLDDFADLPEFVVPPAGAYNATVISCEQKKIGTHDAVEIKFRLLETLELASPTDAPVKDGTECGVSFMLDNEFGVGGLKAVLAPIKVAAGTVSARDTMAASVGMTVLLVTKVRSGKGENADKKYLGIHKLEVL